MGSDKGVWGRYMKGKMPPKGMPPKSTHKMPNGHMMSDAEMSKHMNKRGKK